MSDSAIGSVPYVYLKHYWTSYMRRCPECAEEKFHSPGEPKAKDSQEGGSHYKEMNVQPWDVIDTWPIEQRIGAYRAGALKYLMRMGSKDEQVKEIKKARHYCEKLIEVLEHDTRKKD